MKAMPIISIVIVALIAINEIAYIGETSLAWVVIGICVAIILLAINQLAEK